MITALYITYFVFASIAGVSLSILLFKLNFALATLIVGFSVLAWVTRVWGNVLILRKREEVYAHYQKELEAENLRKQQEEYRKQEEELYSTQPVNTKGMN